MRSIIQTIKDDMTAIITGDYVQGVMDLNTLGNLAILRIARKTVTPSPKGLPKLSKGQKQQMRKFYRPYVRFLTDRYHRLYTAKSGGKFYPEYLPEELYSTQVDRYFSDREEARFLDNKCYYYRLFSHVKQPEPVALRIGGSWLDGGLNLVPYETVQDLVEQEPEVVVKRAVNSEGGAGVSFLSGVEKTSEMNRIAGESPSDLVIQKPVSQHPLFAELHRESVNTIRIVSLLTKDRVKVYAACVKIGVGTERVDNGCRGGIYCGLYPDGRLNGFGILDNGEVLYVHPDEGYRFDGKRIPHLERAVRLVKQAHSFMGHFRLISWDVAIDDSGEAVLIEANLSLGGINDVQICSGPLFGKDTKKVLDEVFLHRRTKWTTWL